MKLLRVGPQTLRLPEAGVVRVHYDPSALPSLEDAVGHNRFDDPRPGSLDRYVMRYTATSLRGCLLELLDWLRPNADLAEREASVRSDSAEDAVSAPGLDREPWQPIEDFLRGRRVGVITGSVRILSIDDPVLQAQLDVEPAVRALLDGDEARAALAPEGIQPVRRLHLDQAAVRLSSELGRAITQACSLALRDRPDRPDGIHYRSRHDDAEDCWAMYDHAEIQVGAVVPLSPRLEDHRKALHDVAALWNLALPPEWL